MEKEIIQSILREVGVPADLLGHRYIVCALQLINKEITRYKYADTKAEVKVVLGNYGGKLANEMRPSDVKKIEEILGLDDEV